jgi:hypothetical protein
MPVRAIAGTAIAARDRQKLYVENNQNQNEFVLAIRIKIYRVIEYFF